MLGRELNPGHDMIILIKAYRIVEKHMVRF